MSFSVHETEIIRIGHDHRWPVAAIAAVLGKNRHVVRSKVDSMALPRPPRDKSLRCHAIGRNGVRCSQLTRDPSGVCVYHRKP